MALGDIYSNGNGATRKVFDSTYYSRTRIKNKDHLVISFSFNKGLLKLEVAEEKSDFTTGDPIGSISISPTKAKLLIERIETLLKRIEAGEVIDPNEGYGINTGVRETTTFIAFKVTGNRVDVPEHSFVLGKVDSTGTIQDVIEFVFNVDYDYSLYWSNIDKMEVTKEIDQFMGIKTIRDVLKEFAYHSSGATGATVWDTGRYEVNRIVSRFDEIYDKLGIERRGYSRNSGGDNYFSRQNNSSSGGFSGMNPPERGHSESKSYDEIMEDLN